MRALRLALRPCILPGMENSRGAGQQLTAVRSLSFVWLPRAKRKRVRTNGPIFSGGSSRSFLLQGGSQNDRGLIPQCGCRSSRSYGSHIRSPSGPAAYRTISELARALMGRKRSQQAPSRAPTTPLRRGAPTGLRPCWRSCRSHDLGGQHEPHLDRSWPWPEVPPGLARAGGAAT